MHVFVELSAYVPGEQSVQKPSNDFAQDCRAPAGQLAHAMHCGWLVCDWYCPLGQSAHVPADLTNRPGVQSMQKPSVAPQPLRTPLDAHASHCVQLSLLVSAWK